MDDVVGTIRSSGSRLDRKAPTAKRPCPAPGLTDGISRQAIRSHFVDSGPSCVSKASQDVRLLTGPCIWRVSWHVADQAPPRRTKVQRSTESYSEVLSLRKQSGFSPRRDALQTFAALRAIPAFGSNMAGTCRRSTNDSGLQESWIPARPRTRGKSSTLKGFLGEEYKMICPRVSPLGVVRRHERAWLPTASPLTYLSWQTPRIKSSILLSHGVQTENSGVPPHGRSRCGYGKGGVSSDPVAVPGVRPAPRPANHARPLPPSTVHNGQQSRI